MRRLTLPVLLLAIAPVGAGEGARFRFSGPEVLKLDWNARGLVAADLDGDGKTDLALLNNDRAKIELLFQKAPDGKGGKEAPAKRLTGRWEPVLEDARLERKSVVTGQSMFALAAADLNADGKVDLAYTGKPDGLTVRFQAADGTWEAKRVFDIPSPLQWTSTLLANDLNGDGRADLAVLAQKELLLFTQDANGGGSLSGPDHYPLADEGCYGIQGSDVDGDSRTDLLYLAPNRRDALRIRLGLAAGGFGPERPFPMEPPRTLVCPLRLGQAQAFASIQAQTGLLEFLSLQRAAGEGPLETLQPRFFSTRAGAKVPSAYALGDLNADGRTDLVATDPDGAEVLVFLRQPDGELSEGRRFPALADARAAAMADLDGDGKAELVLASPKEKVLAVSRLGTDGRLGYPQPLPSEGKPLTVAASDLDADGKTDLAYLFEEGGKRSLGLLFQQAGGAWRAKTQELQGLKTDPRGLKVLDANQDGRPDLAVFVLQEPLRLMLQDAQGEFREAAGFRKGLVDNLDPAALERADLTGDGKAEMLVASTGFARALRMTEGGALEVVDQFNARESDQEIALALSADLDGDGAPEILLAPRKSEELQLLRKDAQGVFRFSKSLALGRLELVGAELGVLDGKPELFLFGRDRFAWIPLGRPGLALRSTGTYESDLQEVAYAQVVAADFNADGQSDLALIDGGEEHFLEILSKGPAGWTSGLRFALFETDPHYQGRKGSGQEPREAVAADLTGDGKADLALLAHDRLLLYPQE